MDVETLAVSLDTSGVVAGVAKMQAASAQVSQSANSMLASIERLQQKGWDRLTAGMMAAARQSDGIIYNTHGNNWGRGMERLQQQQQRSVENLFQSRTATAQPVGDMMARMSTKALAGMQGGTGVEKWVDGLGKLKMAALSIEGPMLKFQRAMQASAASVGGFLKKVADSADTMQTLSAAFAGFGLGAFVRETVLLAARYDTLGVSMYRVGANAGFTRDQMDALQKGMEHTGISALQSRQQLLAMAEAQIDMSQAAKLARVAQDAAVIANINSSEAFGRMIHGLQTGNILILRNLGLSVNFQAAYERKAKAIGKATEALTEEERAQARVETVLKKGITIAGTYEAAMETAGKQLNSSVRYLENFKVKFGEAFQPSFAVAVKAYADTLKWLAENTDKVAAAVGGLAGLITATLIPAMLKWTIAAAPLLITPPGLAALAAGLLAGTVAWEKYADAMKQAQKVQEANSDPKKANAAYQAVFNERLRRSKARSEGRDPNAMTAGQAFGTGDDTRLRRMSDKELADEMKMWAAIMRTQSVEAGNVAREANKAEMMFGAAYDKWAEVNKKRRQDMTDADKEAARKKYRQLVKPDPDADVPDQSGAARKEHDKRVDEQLAGIKRLSDAVNAYWDQWKNNEYLVEASRQQEAALQKMLSDTQLSPEDRARIEEEIRSLHANLTDKLATDPLRFTVAPPDTSATVKVLLDWWDVVNDEVAKGMQRRSSKNPNALPDYWKTPERPEGEPPPGYDKDGKPIIPEHLRGSGKAVESAAQDAEEKISLVKEAWIQAARSMQTATAEFIKSMVTGFKNVKDIIRELLLSLADVFAQAAAAGLIGFVSSAVTKVSPVSQPNKNPNPNKMPGYDSGMAKGTTVKGPTLDLRSTVSAAPAQSTVSSVPVQSVRMASSRSESGDRWGSAPRGKDAGQTMNVQLNQTFATSALDAKGVHDWFRSNKEVVAASVVEAIQRNSMLRAAMTGGR